MLGVQALLLLLVPVRLDITDVFAGVRRALSLPDADAGLCDGDGWCWGSLLLGENVQDGAVRTATVRVSPALEGVLVEDITGQRVRESYLDWFGPAGPADDEGWEENYGGDVLTQLSAQ